MCDRATRSARLLEAIHAADDHITTGVLGARVIFRVLTERGDADLAIKLITRPDAPSYGVMIADGHTTLTEDILSRYTYTNHSPDPDLVIRTGGDFRVSNFLLWQIAYSEFYITDTFWPDFGRDDILLALDSYAKRQRRFGGLVGEDK